MGENFPQSGHPDSRYNFLMSPGKNSGFSLLEKGGRQGGQIGQIFDNSDVYTFGRFSKDF
jgi:hypothetical protein